MQAVEDHTNAQLGFVIAIITMAKICDASTRERRDDRPVIARAELALHDARLGARGQRLGGQHVVETPADVALAACCATAPTR